MYRNSDTTYDLTSVIYRIGCNIYDISNIISITGTNASAGYYYFFYDWEIQKAACATNVMPVEAIIHPEYSTTQNIDLCNGGSVTVGNNTYNSTGVYTDVFTTTNGCDSTIITDLTVGNTSVTTNNINIFGFYLFRLKLHTNG